MPFFPFILELYRYEKCHQLLIIKSIDVERTCSLLWFLFSTGNCRRFTMCVTNGLRLLQYDGSCAPGFEFSARQLHCLPVEVAGCSVPETSTTVTTQSTTPSIATTRNSDPPVFMCPTPGQFADPGSCSHYLVCTWKAGGGLQALRTACTANLVYDTGLKQCVYTTNCGSRPRL